MPFHNFKILVILCICIPVWSCHKKQSEDQITSERTALLLGSWKLVSMTSDKPFDWDNNGTIETDYYSTLTTCEKDKLITFSTPSQGLHKLACNESKDFNWELKERGAYIDIHYPLTGTNTWAGSTSWNIVTISNSLLKLKWNIPSPINTLTSFEAIFQKQ